MVGRRLEEDTGLQPLYGSTNRRSHGSSPPTHLAIIESRWVHLMSFMSASIYRTRSFWEQYRPTWDIRYSLQPFSERQQPLSD